MKGLAKFSILLEHLPLSCLIGIGGAFLFHNGYCLLAALIAGWLIDGDHLADFTYYVIRNYPNIDFSLARGGGYFKQNQKVFVPLHTWELTLVLLIAGIVFKLSPLIIAAIAHGAHLIQDQLVYRVRILGYSLLSRAMNHFSLNSFCLGKRD